QPITMAAALDRFVLDARFSPDGARLAVLVLTLGGKPFPTNGSPGDSPAELEVWEVPTDKRLRSAKLQTGDYGNLAFRPDGRQVAVRLNQFEGRTIDTGHNRVTVVELETGRLVHTLEGKPINEAIVYSPDGSLLVGPLDFHTLNVWDAESGRGVHTLDTKQAIIPDAGFRPDGARLAVVGDGGLVTIWSVPGWEPLQSLRVSEQHAMRCRYSRDGKSLATLGLNWTRIWDGVTGEYRFLIRGARFDLDFTPDGAMIAAAGGAGTGRLV